jgi:hypothetical protein
MICCVSGLRILSGFEMLVFDLATDFSSVSANDICEEIGSDFLIWTAFGMPETDFWNEIFFYQAHDLCHAHGLFSEVKNRALDRGLFGPFSKVK